MGDAEQFERTDCRLGGNVCASAFEGLSWDSFVQDMLEALPQATALTTRGRVLHANGEFLRMFECTLSEALGRDLDELAIPDGQWHEEELAAHQLERIGRANFETRRRTRRGRLLEVQLTASRLRLGGETSGLVVGFAEIGGRTAEGERLTHLSLHDELTGLANRVLFLNRAELMLSRLRRRPERGFAVFFVDLDEFKRVNDEFGHAAGDTVLIEVADRLRRCVRPQDTVARLGGDEFALLLDEMDTEEELGRIAARLLGEIGRTISLPPEWATVSASIGIVLAWRSYRDAEAMLHDADQAMYKAKRAGKAGWSVCDGYRVPGVERAL
jgi:Amt family ammonium transporter